MHKVRLGLSAGILIAWGVGTGAAFWHLEAAYMRPASRPRGAATATPERCPPSPIPSLETDQGRLVLNSGKPLLLNFWNPTCSCSRYNEAHVRDLVKEFRPRGVRFITVVECGASYQERTTAMAAWQGRDVPSDAVVLDGGGKIARTFGVWAAPAAVLLDSGGHVTYVGAYNIARYCDNRDTAWAEQALDALLAGYKPTRPRTPFFGCQVLPQAPIPR